MSKIALLVLYNHKFERNIQRIFELYRNRFTFVYQLIPFYEGNVENVIPVYGSSYYFQTFISQAYAKLKTESFTHYFIVSDDMIINPDINENNIFAMIGVSEEDCLISNFIPLQSISYRSNWVKNALNYRVRKPGVEVEKILPLKEEAENCFKSFNLPIGPIPFKYFFKLYKIPIWKAIAAWFKEFPYFFKRRLPYPIVHAYSDIFMITDEVMEKFSTYIGAFAATELFVEYAIPTATVLAIDKRHLKFINDSRLKDGGMWSYAEIDHFAEKYDYKLDNLVNNFPKDKLFVHPIKLSKWK